MTEIETVRTGRGSARRPRGLLAATAAALALAAWPAGPARAEGPRGFGEVRVGLMHFDYAEHDAAGTFLDGEKGWVPALTGELELRGEQLFGRALLRYAKGTVSYDGHVQSAGDPLSPYVDGLPVQTDSDATFLQGELQGGVLLGPAKQVAVFGALGARRWDRDIQSATVISRPIPPGLPPPLPPGGAPNGLPVQISGLSEVYSWYELQLGVRWTFLSRPGTSWDVEARLVRTASPEIKVDLTPFVGAPASTTLSLGATTGWRLGSTFRHDLNPRGLFLAANAYLEGYSFDASGVDPVYLIMEPDSTTVNFGLEVGIGGRF
jgi:hypothetical protein